MGLLVDTISTILSSSSQTITAAVVILLSTAFALIVWTNTPTNAPDLPGPRGWPIVGSYFQRGADPADTYHRWSKIYGPVFRVRIGCKWAIVINTADAGDELLAGSTYGAVFQSRPMPYTLGQLFKHATRSSITLGTSPYDDLVKDKRRMSIASVSPASSKAYDPIINRAGQAFVRDFSDVAKRGGPIDPWPLCFSSSATLALTVLFGASFEEARRLFDGIPYPMERLGQIRSLNGRSRDFFPFLRLLPEERRFKEAVAVAKFRTGKLGGLLNRTRSKFAEGTAEACAVVSMMSDTKSVLTDEALTSVSNSMVSSGLDSHMPHLLLWAFGVLATNKEIQEKCYQAVVRQERLGIPIDQDRENYLMAFIKEVGRYFTTFRLSVARETMTKDVVWQGHYIPKGTTVWCNAHAMNRDETRFQTPEKFIPERYISGPEAERAVPHYGFGLGRRMCPAIYFVHKELYAVLSNIVAYYEIDHHDGESEFHAVRGCGNGWDFNQGPKQFRIKMNIRDPQKLDSFLNRELPEA